MSVARAQEIAERLLEHRCQSTDIEQRFVHVIHNCDR